MPLHHWKGPALETGTGLPVKGQEVKEEEAWSWFSIGAVVVWWLVAFKLTLG